MKFGEKELDLIRSLNEELFRLYFEKVGVKTLDRSSTSVDKLYRESKERVYRNPVEVDAFVVRNPAEELLSKFGIDERRELLVTFSKPLLDEMNLTVSIGDRVVLSSGEEYEILSVSSERGDYFGNTGKAVQIIVTAKRATENAG